MKVSAPAKINLFLHVTGRREDGYHLLRTLMCCIGLYDFLTLDFGAAANTLTCCHPDVPSDDTNLVMQALRAYNGALTEATSIVPKNVAVQLEKHIPAGAGLGGGSSDAAAVLNCLNRHYGHPLNDSMMHDLALSLGADVPFFIHGVPAWATGIGERLTPFTGLEKKAVVVVYPGFGIATAEVFKNLNLRLTKCEKHLRYFPFKYGKNDMARHLCNDLETVAIQQFPQIREIKNLLKNRGATGSLMSGSGSAVYGLFDDDRTAQKTAEALEGTAEWQVFSTALLV